MCELKLIMQKGIRETIDIFRFRITNYKNYYYDILKMDFRTNYNHSLNKL